MSDDNSIFGSENTQDQNQAQSQSTTPTIPPGLEEFVGVGKKYSSTEEALKSVPHAQNYIKQLEERARQLEADLNKSKATEDLIDQLKSEMSTSNTTRNVEIDESKITASASDAAARQVLELLEQKENVRKVDAAFEQLFGNDKRKTAFEQVAAQSGFTLNELKALSAKKPQAVIALAKSITGSSGNVPLAKSESSVNTQALNNQGNTQEISARVTGKTTKDIVAAWQRAGQKVAQNNT